MNILSVDWDFFFPDIMVFDWQMNEENFLYYEMLWTIRWSNFGLFDRNLVASQYMNPRSTWLKFWSLVEERIHHWETDLIITDSHKDITSFISFDANIWNFDQHHDCGYGDRKKLTCGNWVRKCYDRKKIESFNQIYPAWRKEQKESKMVPAWANIYYEGESLNLPKTFDIVFICRSSPWTPSWSDGMWLRFIEWFKLNRKAVWRTKIALDYVLRLRPFSFKDAISFKKQTNEAIARYKEEDGKIKSM